MACITSNCLFVELPLEHLDLTGFLNVTDDGAKQIADMKHLRYLSLDGTKVTDAGVELFKDLIELEKLYLDRTLITDVGLSQLIGTHIFLKKGIKKRDIHLQIIRAF